MNAGPGQIGGNGDPGSSLKLNGQGTTNLGNKPAHDELSLEQQPYAPIIPDNRTLLAQAPGPRATDAGSGTGPGGAPATSQYRLKVKFVKGKIIFGPAVNNGPKGRSQYQEFKQLAGKRPSTINIFHHLQTSRGFNFNFPTSEANWIADQGAIPNIKMETRNPDTNTFPISIDDQIKELRQSLAPGGSSTQTYSLYVQWFTGLLNWQKGRSHKGQQGYPIIISPVGHEMNVEKTAARYYWWAGQGKKFMELRHLVIEVAKRISTPWGGNLADSITWSINFNNDPPLFREYLEAYPDEYDLILMHDYNSSLAGKSRTAEEMFNKPYGILVGIVNDLKRKYSHLKDKPINIGIGETGHDATRPGQEKWWTSLHTWINKKDVDISYVVPFWVDDFEFDDGAGISRFFEYTVKEGSLSKASVTRMLAGSRYSWNDFFVEKSGQPTLVYFKPGIKATINTITDTRLKQKLSEKLLEAEQRQAGWQAARSLFQDVRFTGKVVTGKSEIFELKEPQPVMIINFLGLASNPVSTWLNQKLGRVAATLSKWTTDFQMEIDSPSGLYYGRLTERDLTSEKLNLYLWNWLVRSNEQGYSSWTLAKDIAFQGNKYNKFELLRHIILLKLSKLASTAIASRGIHFPRNAGESMPAFQMRQVKQVLKLEARSLGYLSSPLAQINMSWAEGLMWKVSSNATAATKYKIFDQAIVRLNEALEFAKTAEDILKTKFRARPFAAAALIARIHQDLGDAYLSKALAAQEIWRNTNNTAMYSSAESLKRQAFTAYREAYKRTPKSPGPQDSKSTYAYDRFRPYVLNLRSIQAIASIEAFNYPMRNSLERRALPAFSRYANVKPGDSIPALVAKLDKLLNSSAPLVSVARSLKPDETHRYIVDPVAGDRYLLEREDSPIVIIDAFKQEVLETRRMLIERKIALLKWQLEEDPSVNKVTQQQIIDALFAQYKSEAAALVSKIYHQPFAGTAVSVDERNKALGIENPKKRLDLIRAVRLSNGGTHLTLAEVYVDKINAGLTELQAALGEGYSVPALFAGLTQGFARRFFVARENAPNPLALNTNQVRDNSTKAYTHKKTYDYVAARVWYAKAERTQVGDNWLLSSTEKRARLEKLYDEILVPAQSTLRGFDAEELKLTMADNLSGRAYIAKNLGDRATYFRLATQALELLDSGPLEYDPDPNKSMARRETAGEAYLLKAKIIKSMVGELEYEDTLKELSKIFQKERAKGMPAPDITSIKTSQGVPQAELAALNYIERTYVPKAGAMVKYESKNEVDLLEGTCKAQRAFVMRDLRMGGYRELLDQAKYIIQHKAIHGNNGPLLKGGRRSTRGEGGHWLAKITVVKVGDMRIGDLAEGFKVTNDAAILASIQELKLRAENQVAITTGQGRSATTRKVVYQSAEQLAGMLKAGDRVNKVIATDADLVDYQLQEIESTAPDINNVRREKLLVGKALYDLNATDAEIHFIRASLNKDKGKIKAFRANAKKALILLAGTLKMNKGYSNPFVIEAGKDKFAGGVPTVVRGYITLANFLAAISGDKRESAKLQPVLQQHFSQFGIQFSPSDHETTVEYHLLQHSTRISRQALALGWNTATGTKRETWIIGRERVAAEKDQDGSELRFTYLFRDLVIKKNLPTGKALDKAVERLELFLSPDDRKEFTALTSTTEGKQDLLVKYQKKFQGIYDAAKTSLEHIRDDSNRAELVDESKVLLAQASASIAADVDDLMAERDILDTEVVNPLRTLLQGNNMLRGRNLVAANHLLGKNIKTVGSITQDIDGYIWQDPITKARRGSPQAERLFTEAVQHLQRTVQTSARRDLIAESRVEIGEIKAIRAGNEMDPAVEMQRVKSAEAEINAGLHLRYIDEKGAQVLSGRSLIVAESGSTRMIMRRGFLRRQMLGRTDQEAQKLLNGTRIRLAVILNSRRGDLVLSAMTDQALMRYVEAADANQSIATYDRKNGSWIFQTEITVTRKIKNGTTKDEKEGKLMDGNDQEVERAVLNLQVLPAVRYVLDSNRQTGRSKFETRKLFGDTQVRLGLVGREIYGKEDTQERAHVTRGKRQLEIVAACGIKELTDEVAITRTRIRLVESSDQENDRVELGLVSQATPILMNRNEVAPSGLKAAAQPLADSPNLSSRARLDLKLAKVEAFGRLSFTFRDLPEWGVGDKKADILKRHLYPLTRKLYDALGEYRAQKEEEQSKRLAGQTNGTLKPVTDRVKQAKAKLDAVRAELDTELKGQQLKQKRESANYFYLRAWQEVLPVLTCGRRDLEAVADFWVAQLISVFAEDTKDLLFIAEMYADKAHKSGELRGSQYIDSFFSVADVKSRLAGLFNEKPHLKPWETVYKANQAIDALFAGMQLIAQRSWISKKDRQSIGKLLKKDLKDFIDRIKDKIPKRNVLVLASALNKASDLKSWCTMGWALDATWEYSVIGAGLLDQVSKRFKATNLPIDSKLRRQLGANCITRAEMMRYKHEPFWRSSSSQAHPDIDYDQAEKLYLLALTHLETDAEKERAANPKAESKEETATAFSILTLRAKAHVGLANLYADQDWESGRSRTKAQDHLDEADKDLKLIEQLGSWTSEQDQLKRSYFQALRIKRNIYDVRASLAYSATHYVSSGVDSHNLTAKVEIPFWNGRLRFSPELNLQKVTGVDDWLAQPILSLSAHGNLGGYKGGLFNLSHSWLIPTTEQQANLDFRTDISLKLRDHLTIQASHHHQEFDNYSKWSVWAGIYTRPASFFPNAIHTALNKVVLGWENVVYSYPDTYTPPENPSMPEMRSRLGNTSSVRVGIEDIDLPAFWGVLPGWTSLSWSVNMPIEPLTMRLSEDFKTNEADPTYDNALFMFDHRLSITPPFKDPFFGWLLRIDATFNIGIDKDLNLKQFGGGVQATINF